MFLYFSFSIIFYSSINAVQGAVESFLALARALTAGEGGGGWGGGTMARALTAGWQALIDAACCYAMAFVSLNIYFLFVFVVVLLALT